MYHLWFKSIHALAQIEQAQVMDADEVCGLLRKLSRPSQLSKDGRLIAIKLANVVQAYLRSSAERHVSGAGALPALYVYMSDGWGRHVQESFGDSNSLVVRCGRHRAEFLLERGLVKTLGAAGRLDLGWPGWAG
jgi:hypothetical protein